MLRLIRISVLLCLLFVSGRGVCLSFDNWEVVYEKEGVVINQIDFYDEYLAVAIGDNGLVLLTTDGGETWNDHSDVNMGNLTTIEVVTDQLFFCASSTMVYRSTDIAKGWDKVFDKPNVKINSVTWTFGAVKERVHISCDDATLYSSINRGADWFKVDVSKWLKGDDDILYCVAGEMAQLSDTLYRIVSRDRGYIYSWDNLQTLIQDDDPTGSVKIKVLHNPMDFNVPRFTADFAYTGMNNEVWIQESVSSKRPASWYSINDCIYVRYLAGDDWYGFAVGDSGRIEEVATNGFGIPKQISSPTTKDLNWIDWGADPETESLFGVATFCAVGDGVILRKRWGWEPVTAPRIAHHVSTDLYPNPSDDYFKIESNGWDAGERVTVRLYNLSGILVKELYQGVLDNGNLALEVNDVLESGLYMVELSSKTKREVKRLIRN